MISNWSTNSLAELIYPIETIDPKKEPEKLFTYIDVSSVSNRTLAVTENTEILGVNAPSRARRRVRSGDVIFATIRPTLQRIAVIPENLDSAICSTGYFVFRTRAFIEPKFLYYYLQSVPFMADMESCQSGASYPAVSDTQVKQHNISYPNQAEQKRIVAIIDEAFKGVAVAIANTEKSLVNVRELFRSFIIRLFSSW